jgi:GMP synthase-like glutamine amidotransferase
MKPIALFQHSLFAEPGFVQQYLDEKGLPWQLFRVDLGDPTPASARDFSGLCFLGGVMSVNDPAPWIGEEIALIHEADAAGVPMVGHCFGSQLMAKAFGASVTRNPVKEIGWGRMTAHDTATTREWLGLNGPVTVPSFQWHGDTFDVPPGAELFLSSDYCKNQGFVIGDRHLGMQCHLEMTPELVRKCTVKGAREVERELQTNTSGSVQDIPAMLEDLESRSAQINATMRALYDRWIKGLAIER